MAAARAGPSLYLVARISGIAAAALGAAVLAGWAFDLTLLKQLSASIPATKANAAFAFFVLGIALALFARPEPESSRRLLAVAAGAGCVALAGLTLLEYSWRDLGIDELLFEDTSGSPLPGRPAPHAAIGVLLAGLNLILLARSGSRASRPRHSLAGAWLNNMLAVVVMTGAIGYAYSVEYLRGFSSVNGIGVVALIVLALLSIGLAALDPGETWLSVFISPSAGGRMARRLGPLLLLAPISIGAQHAFYDSPLGRAVAALGITAAFIIALLAGVFALDRTEAQRKILSGLLPICSHCKRIRDDKGYWNQVESYVAKYSDADFSHSLCPNCLREHYPEHAEEVIRRLEESGLVEARLLGFGPNAEDR